MTEATPSRGAAPAISGSTRSSPPPAPRARAALVGYLPAGYPTVDGSRGLLTQALDAGADLVEVGVPYSDPVMDGPTIQPAAETALRGGVRLRDVLDRRRAGRRAPAAGPSS